MIMILLLLVALQTRPDQPPTGVFRSSLTRQNHTLACSRACVRVRAGSPSSGHQPLLPEKEEVKTSCFTGPVTDVSDEHLPEGSVVDVLSLLLPVVEWSYSTDTTRRIQLPAAALLFPPGCLHSFAIVEWKHLRAERLVHLSVDQKILFPFRLACPPPVIIRESNPQEWC